MKMNCWHSDEQEYTLSKPWFYPNGEIDERIKRSNGNIKDLEKNMLFTYQPSELEKLN